MQRFKNILLVHDRKNKGEFALNRAIHLAKANKAKLTVVDILDDIPHLKEKLFFEILHYDLHDLVLKERQRELHEFITPIQKEKIKVTTKILFGTPFIEIIREVLRSKIDLVIKTAQGGGGLKEALLGTTAMHLMRKCPCPVWVIKPSRVHTFYRILAAIDWPLQPNSCKLLNNKIMDIAVSLAHQGQSQLHIMHAWNVNYESILRGSAFLPAHKLNSLVRKNKKMHRQWLTRVLERYPLLADLKYQVHLLKGEASNLVPQLVKKKKINLIVMGTICRSGIEGLLIGNTAEKTLQEADCSILALKPDDFVSPVTLF